MCALSTRALIRSSDSEPVFLTVAQFCAQHAISKSYFYKLRAMGRAPSSCLIGRKRVIATEDAARWRRNLMENGK